MKLSKAVRREHKKGRIKGYRKDSDDREQDKSVIRKKRKQKEKLLDTLCFED